MQGMNRFIIFKRFGLISIFQNEKVRVCNMQITKHLQKNEKANLSFFVNAW